MDTTNSFRRIFAALLFSILGVTAVALTACNTTEGFGRDVEATGDAIEDAAD